MTAVRLTVGNAAVLLAAIVVSWVAANALLSLGIPPEATGALSVLTLVPVAAVGAALLGRRTPVSHPAMLPAVAAAGIVLGLMTLFGSASALWFRLAVLALLVGLSLLGAHLAVRAQQPTPWPAGHRSEAGSGSLEFVGVVVLAAVLVAAAVGATAVSSPAARDRIWAAICKITGGSCTPADAPSNRDYMPSECEVYSAEERIGATVDIAIVRIGGATAIQRVEKSSGEVELTVLDEGRGGVAGGVGGHGNLSFGDRTIGVDVEAEAAATAGLQAGETYVFDDAAQADTFEDYLRAEKAQDLVAAGHLGFRAANAVWESLTDEQPPDNGGVQKTFVRFDEQVSVSLGGSLGFGAGAGIEIEGLAALGMEHDRGEDADDPGDDKETVYVQVDWGVEGSAGLPMVKGADFTGTGSGIVKVTTSADGSADEVQIVSRGGGGFEIGLAVDEHSTSPVGSDRAPSGLESFGVDFKAGSGGTTVVTQTLALDSPERRDAFAGWLTSGGATNLAATTAASSGWADSETGENVTSFGDGSDGFADLMADQAKVSVVEYDEDTWGLGGGLGVSLAVKAGLDADYSDREATAVNAAYLGAPDAEGRRAAYDLPDCVR